VTGRACGTLSGFRHSVNNLLIFLYLMFREQEPAGPAAKVPDDRDVLEDLDADELYAAFEARAPRTPDRARERRARGRRAPLHARWNQSSRGSAGGGR